MEIPLGAVDTEDDSSADPGVLKILVILVNDMVIFGTHIPVQVYVKGTITERF